MDERVIKYYQKELNNTEQIKLLGEAESDSQLRKDMMDIQNILSLTDLEASLTDFDAGNKGYQHFLSIRRKQRASIISLTILRYAAVFLIGIFSTWFIYSQLQSSAESSIAQVLTVPDGQRAHIVLPDGSTVWVNAHSKLRYLSSFNKERKVELSGEAYFDVVKDERHPFIVTTNGRQNIKVLGTSFNVFAYPDEPLTVSLLRGKVEVSELKDEKDLAVLLPNQQLTEKDGRYVISAIEEDPIMWKDGIYLFSKQRMKTIIKKLELYYDVHITVKDAAIENLEVSCKFRQRDGVMEILRLIQKVHPFKIEKNDETNEITLYH